MSKKHIAFGLALTFLGGTIAGLGLDTMFDNHAESERAALLSAIRSSETGGDYNYDASMLFYNQNVRELTLEEIVLGQENASPREYPSVAVGAYAFTNATLRSLIDKYQIPTTEVFTVELQNKLANTMIKDCEESARGLYDCVRDQWSTLRPSGYSLDIIKM